MIDDPPAPGDVDIPPPPEDLGPDDGDGDHGRWITVATFDDSVRANMARLKLESEGIACFLADEMLVSTDWLMSNAVGGIKLQVREGQVAAARAILARVRPADFLDDEAQALVCPRCGSNRLLPMWKSPGVLALSLFLVGIPMLMMLGKYRCEKCGKIFRAPAG